MAVDTSLQLARHARGLHTKLSVQTVSLELSCHPWVTNTLASSLCVDFHCDPSFFLKGVSWIRDISHPWFSFCFSEHPPTPFHAPFQFLWHGQPLLRRLNACRVSQTCRAFTCAANYQTRTHCRHQDQLSESPFLFCHPNHPRWQKQRSNQIQNKWIGKVAR